MWKHATFSVLFRPGINVESTFQFLDRYKKGFIADTDVWQCMHIDGGKGSLSFAGVCTLFREVKAPGAKKVGPLRLSHRRTIGRLVFVIRHCFSFSMYEGFVQS